MNFDKPQPRPEILSIKAYAPGESKVAGKSKIYKLASNENPLGPSARALEAYNKAATHLELYPDGASTALREAIAAEFSIPSHQIICGAGSDEVLSLLMSAYLSKGDEGIYCEHGFLVYKLGILAAGGTPVCVPENNLHTDVDAILAHITAKTKIILIANPNNPTGTYLPFAEIERLAANIPSHVLLVLDAAYAEFVRENDYQAGLELVKKSNNVVMTRTFSKIHGLAALRLGWCYGPAEVIDVLNRIRGPFNVAEPAIQAGIASISDHEHLENTYQFNKKWLDKITHELIQMGLKVTPSVTNFILVHFPLEAGQTSADVDAHLKSDGIIVRRMEAYALPHTLRISIGTEEANLALLQSLSTFMKSNHAKSNIKHAI